MSAIIDRYKACFARTQKSSSFFAKLAGKSQAKGVFIPFIMLEDPNLETSFTIICTLIANGADGLELGIAFSDPAADGPVIQQAANRALAAGSTTQRALGLVARVREKYPEIPIGLLVYANLVMNNSIDAFYQLAADSGVDSVLVADVPFVESAPFVACAKAHGIAPVMIVPQNVPVATLKQIARVSEGYIYLQARAGVTGVRQTMEKPAENLLQALKAEQAVPAIMGFGISTPEHVRMALEAGADGAISGSAVVQIIERNLADQPKMLAELGEFVQKMKAACVARV